MSHATLLRSCGVALLAWFGCAVAAPVAAQCATHWVPGPPLNGADGSIQAATAWDPDGAGPMGWRVALAGQFTLAGSVAASGIATWDPATDTWSTLGSGTSGVGEGIFALATLPNGDLLAAGRFTMIDGVQANSVARWDGTRWTALGTGVKGTILALRVLANGDLVVAGAFSAAGGVPANNIARWDGSLWSPLSSGLGLNVRALTTLANGDLVAGGYLTAPGGAFVGVARWNGTAWSALGSGVSGPVFALTTLLNGDLIVGGEFTSAGGVSANRVARWDGASWSPMGSGMPNLRNLTGVRSLTTLANGDVIAGGDFTWAGGVLAPGIARWNGTAWTSVGSGVYASTPNLRPTVSALAELPNGNLIAGGGFTHAGFTAASNVALWNGTSWSQVGSGLGDVIRSMTGDSNGHLIIGGDFKAIGGLPANAIARWDGLTWAALGSGLTGTSSSTHTGASVLALLALSNGDVIAGGAFTLAGGVAVNGVARWDGGAWSALGSGVGGAGVAALTALPNGDVIAGGSFTTAGGVPAGNVARWNGAAWSGLAGGTNGQVLALDVLPSGDVIAGGTFSAAGTATASCIARWNGSSWSSLGSRTNGRVTALLTLPGGDVIAGGWFTTAGGVPANRISRWDGASWAPLGSGTDGGVNSLARLPNGDVIVGGAFTTAGGVPANRIARWNGSTWSAFGLGLQGTPVPPSFSTFVRNLAALSNGVVVASGSFFEAGGGVSANLAQLATTCPATASPHGVGCSGSGGANTLTATTLPWIDTTFRAMATGLPTNALVLTLTGVASFPQGAAPLALLFPQAGPNCDLLATPDMLSLLVTTTGTAQSSLFLPNVPPLVGVTFHHQMVPIELDALGNWVAVTATNALQLTAGTF